MLTVSDRFKAACRTHRQMVTKCELWHVGTNAKVGTFALKSLTFNQDRSVQSRTNVRLTMPGNHSFVPEAAFKPEAQAYANAELVKYGARGDRYGEYSREYLSGLLNVTDAEIKPFMGVRFSDGTDEYVPLGTLRIGGFKFVEDPAGDFYIELNAYDRARQLDRAGFPSPVVIAGGTNAVAAIESLITGGIPGSTFRAVPTNHVVGRTVLGLSGATQNRAKVVAKIAESIGYEVFPANDGVWVIRPIPRPDPTASVWTIDAGEGGILSHGIREFDDQNTFSVVIVSSSNSANGRGYRAVAMDQNPNSPTRVSGPFGYVTKEYVNPHISSQAQAQDMANALLDQQLGVDEVFTASILPMPALECSDVVSTFDPELSLIDDAFVIETLTLEADETLLMTVTGRKRRGQ